ncbi:MAG: hypothetical protein ABSD68_00635 [Candidatus Micrarchaeales archaeon]|jgi:hypothetical protein
MENVKAICPEKKERERRDKAFVEAALRHSWRSDTSFFPEEWSTANPMRGQCAVTALVVQDYLGGRLIVVDVLTGGKQSDLHFYNELEDGKRVDLTRLQFAEGTAFGAPKYAEREDVLSYPDTVKRYELLKSRVEETLGRYRSGMKILEACPLRSSPKA